MIDRWRDLGETLARNRLRTLLTAGSVAWGMFVLVVLLGMGTGLENHVRYQFRDDAINSLWLWPGTTSVPVSGLPVGRRVRFDDDDYDYLRGSVDGVERVTGRFWINGDTTVSHGDQHASFGVRAVHPDHQVLENTRVVAGRFIDDLDIARERKVIAISAEVRDFLFHGEDPLGQRVDLLHLPWTVVGVFEDDGGPFESKMVYIPITTARIAANGGRRIHQLMFTIDPRSTVEDAQRFEATMRDLFARRKRFAPGDKQALRIRDNVEEFGKVQQIFVWIHAFVWMVGAGTVAAGIVGVSNIMLVSVNERTAEIGIRKAVGATPIAIVWMIVEEAVALTAIAGYAGLVAGVLALEAVDRAAPENDYVLHPTVDLSTALAAMALLVLSGATAGFVPAWRAARVRPMDALRSA